MPSALPIHVVVMELMGRNAGWITAASALFAGQMPCEHLVYLPETDFDKEQFLSAVKEKWAKGRGLLVTVSEGIHYADGSPVADSGIVDGFGHKIPGGAAQTLSDMIMQETGLKSRSEKPGLLGRVSVALMSEVDQREAQEAGAAAVRAAVEGKTGLYGGLPDHPGAGVPHRDLPHSPGAGGQRGEEVPPGVDWRGRSQYPSGVPGLLPASAGRL